VCGKGVLVVLVSVVACAAAQNVVCGKGSSTNKEVTVEDKKTYTFKTQKGKKYPGNTECTVKYKMGDSCAKMSFVCNKFNTNNKDKKKCTKGDKLTVTANGKPKAYCKTKKPKVSSTGDISVVFTSDKKKSGSGAICKVKCTEAAGGGTAPTTVTEAPTTVTAAPTEPVPCVNCTTEDDTPCQFPFIIGSKTYDSCTVDYDSAPWCSTKVDGGGNHISGYWGYCTDSCPADEGFPSTGSGPACQVQTVGFPDTCAPQLAKTNKNILFLGNSYTYFNDLPGMVRSLAAAAGFSATVKSVAPGGQTLGGHVSSSLGQITSGDWDVVVIQDQSQRPSFPEGYVYNYIIPEAKTIVDTIRAKNPCTVPVFFLTWGKRDGDSQNCANGNYFCTFEGIQDRLTESYTTFAYLNQPAKVAPAGEAWRNYPNRGALFTSDGSHPSAQGTYLTACTMLETIWGVPCTGNSYQPVGDAAALQALASNTVQARDWAWPGAGGPPCTNCLG